MFNCEQEFSSFKFISSNISNIYFENNARVFEKIHKFTQFSVLFCDNRLLISAFCKHELFVQYVFR